MTDVLPLPHGPEAALNGLREAVSRLREAVSGVLRGRAGYEAIWIALSEALYWVAAMDDRYRGAADYFSRRDKDAGGRTVAGLVYARNSHAHELVSAGEAVFEVGSIRPVQIPPGETAPPPGRGPWFSMQLRWVTLDRLPLPAHVERHGRDVFYQNHIADRPITHPFDDAIGWLERCIAAEASKHTRG